jgi:beta-N-acetylhexosaminidase
LAALCGQLLCVGFEGTTAPPELLERIARREVGTVILFRPNIAGPAELAALVAALRAAAPADTPLVVAVDQEGGLVQRVRAPATVWPSMMAVAAAGDPEVTRAVGRALGDELALFGIGWTFAPVLDVHTNPANPVIGTRAFGTTPVAVATHALAFWRGLGESGVLACGKHFPGHGDTHLDSHHDLPGVAHARERLQNVELAPFAAAVAAGIEAIMVAHVVFPALDPRTPVVPATLSEPIVTGVLRKQLGFDGLIVSDDLGMRAVADRWPIEVIMRDGLLAGLDHFILRGPEARQRAAHAALVDAAANDPIVHARVVESHARVLRFKARARVGLPIAPDALAKALPNPLHEALAARFSGAPSPTPVADSPVAGD